MRVLLVGRAEDRDRVRRELLEAGVEIVAESVSSSEAEVLPHSVDAIVTATGRLAETGGDEVPPLAEEALTPRELDVLALMAEGARRSPSRTGRCSRGSPSILTRAVVDDSLGRWHRRPGVSPMWSAGGCGESPTSGPALRAVAPVSGGMGFAREHGRPLVHVRYAGRKATVEIQTGVLQGELAPTARRAVLE